jgi:hypothetical protein
LQNSQASTPGGAEKGLQYLADLCGIGEVLPHMSFNIQLADTVIVSEAACNRQCFSAIRIVTHGIRPSLQWLEGLAHQAVFIGTKPYLDLRGLAVNATHHLHLLISFFDILLINAEMDETGRPNVALQARLLGFEQYQSSSHARQI